MRGPFLPDERSDREPVLATASNQAIIVSNTTLLRKATSIAFSEAGDLPGIASEGKAGRRRRALQLTPGMPAQRPAEVLGTPTHAQLPNVYKQLTL